MHMLLLYEVLSRLSLPPFEEIPGNVEATADRTSSWTIPATTIDLVRVEEGPREGAFLFDAETVASLETLYRHVRDLPYRKGRAPGIYLDFLESEFSPLTLGRQARLRLKPIDSSNPRSTLDGFLDSVNRAHALVTGADAALRASPPDLSIEDARELEREASDLLKRAAGALDLSRVPNALRDDVGIESTLQLKEILDRITLPPYDAVPGPAQVAAAREAGHQMRWRVPSSEIEIVEITEGERKGEFLFSAGTVRGVSDAYMSVREIPYRIDHAAFTATMNEAYLSAHTSEGFYEFYISTPGFLLPQVTAMGRFLDSLPSWLKERYGLGRHALWQWIGLSLCGFIGIATAIVVIPTVNRFSRRLDEPMNYFVLLLAPATIALVVLTVTGFADADLNITGTSLAAAKSTGTATVYLMGAWALFILFKALAEVIVRSPKILEESLDASLIRIVARVVGFLAGAWLAIEGLSNLGLDLLPLLAGLGVGGLAVALAAQRTLANFIGGLILYANKPVQIGDFCLFGNEMGTVEQIGLQSTQIRTLERSIITIPNGQFSEMQLTNLAPRDRRLFRTTLRLRYETTPEQLRFVLARLRALLLGHPKVSADPGRVRFVSFGGYSKDIEIFAYLLCQDQNTFLAMQEDLLLRIDDIIAEAGTGFAIPSQTAYLSRDKGLDVQRVENAE